MQILITGATGLIGSTLTVRLLQQGHQVTALVRSPERAHTQLPSAVKLITTLSQYSNLNEVDAVINLAGEPIFQRRWSEKQKHRLLHSRVNLTAQITALINQSDRPPHTFISGSATGYYGDKGEALITEKSLPSSHFPSQLCQQWETTALKANTRVCVLRTGIVLSHQGGALSKMLPLYRLGLGGKLGNGQQYWSWIALADMIEGILFLLHHPTCHGAFNFVAPTPIRQAEFNATLGKLLKRPHFATVPAFVLNFLLGERAQLLLDSQKIMPQKLLAEGFQFTYPELAQALQACLK
ncbi:TIGR01777 family oxidoreductase [Pasteurella sp. P03HT]